MGRTAVVALAIAATAGCSSDDSGIGGTDPGLAARVTAVGCDLGGIDLSDDVELRDALCSVQDAIADVADEELAIPADWITRSGDQRARYATDRDAVLADARALHDEIRAAIAAH